jgi:hypothetical protein
MTNNASKEHLKGIFFVFPLLNLERYLPRKWGIITEKWPLILPVAVAKLNHSLYIIKDEENLRDALRYRRVFCYEKS